MLTNYMAYRLVEGRLERVGTSVEDRVITEARTILRDPDLAGPDEQFQKAIAFYSQRPEADEDNCVKEAVGAVEGMAGILLDDHAVVLSGAIRKIGSGKRVQCAFRGDAESAAYGVTGARPRMTLADAELTLNAAGAMVVCLDRLYGKDVE